MRPEPYDKKMDDKAMEQARVEEVIKAVAIKLASFENYNWEDLPNETLTLFTGINKEQLLRRARQIIEDKDKDGKPMLGIISDDQSCRIQRMGSGKIVDTAFDVEYTELDDCVRKVIILEENK